MSKGDRNNEPIMAGGIGGGSGIPADIYNRFNLNQESYEITPEGPVVVGLDEKGHPYKVPIFGGKKSLDDLRHVEISNAEFLELKAPDILQKWIENEDRYLGHCLTFNDGKYIQTFGEGGCGIYRMKIHIDSPLEGFEIPDSRLVSDFTYYIALARYYFAKRELSKSNSD